jgi:hypothetical protein
MLLTMFARRSRAKIAPPIATARERGEPRPYVAVKFPPWVERVARGWIVVFAVSLLTGAVLLVVAVVELRFRR